MGVQVEETEAGRRWRATVTDERGAEVEARAWLGDLHRTHTWLELDDQEIDAASLASLTAALAVAAGLPLAAKAAPQTPKHDLYTQAGATPYQIVPPTLVDLTDPENQAWTETDVDDPPNLEELTQLSAERVLELWIQLYLWVHADWSPVHDTDRAREIFTPMLTSGLRPELSRLASRDAEPTAVAFTFIEGEEILIVCEAAASEVPTGTRDVRACLGAAMAALAEAGHPYVLIDGHVSDPHLFPAVSSIPHRSGTGLHLLQFTAVD